MTWLKVYRTMKGMTQRQLADAVGVSFQAVSAYERGRKEPTMRVAKKLSEVLKVPIDNLVKEAVMDGDGVRFQ